MSGERRRESLTPSGGTAASPRWGGRTQSRDPIALHLAPQFGQSPYTVEHRMRAANQDTAAIVTAMLDLDAVERALDYARPVLVALERIRPQPVRELIQPASQADANEEMAEAAYLLDPCTATRRAFIAKLRRQYTTTLQLLRALEHEEAASVPALA